MPIIERSIQSRVKSLVAGECANHQNEAHGIKNFCWMREKSNRGVCVFYSGLENPKCRYFEEAVLPLDKDLKAIFSSEVLTQEMQENQKRAVRKKCAHCPEIFMAKSNAQVLCPQCQERNGTLKNRERQARFQKNHKNDHRLTESNLASL